jgi:hypothetical protein
MYNSYSIYHCYKATEWLFLEEIVPKVPEFPCDPSEEDFVRASESIWLQASFLLLLCFLSLLCFLLLFKKMAMAFQIGFFDNYRKSVIDFLLV